MSVEIKELQELIERERLAEERVQEAKEKAQDILKKAREKAVSLVQAIESDPQWEKLKQARNDELARQKAEIEEEYKRKTSTLEKAAQKNFERAIQLVIEETLRVEL
jgi:vacuolar-type H+-ATPase subunit H